MYFAKQDIEVIKIEFYSLEKVIVEANFIGSKLNTIL